MTQWLHPRSRGPRIASLRSWAAVLLLTPFAAPLPAQAADTNVHLVLSMKPITQKEHEGFVQRHPRQRKDAWFLRPNVEQELYTYVQIDDPSKKPTVTVALSAPGVQLMSQTIKAEQNFVQVKWPRPEETAKDAPKMPPQLTKPIVMRLLVDGKESGEAIRLDVYRPEDYLTCGYLKDERNGTRLIFQVKPQSNMEAELISPEPPCMVDLVLDPDRIPGLVPANRKRVWSGSVISVTSPDADRDSDSLFLLADEVRLRSSERPGMVTLSADGFERAFRYRITSSEGETLGVNESTRETILRINAPSVVEPKKKVPIILEADNVASPEDKQLILDALTYEDRSGNKHYSRLAAFDGDRQTWWNCAGGGEHGGLRLKPVVKDWSTEVDLSGFQGDVTLRLRLLNKKGNKNQAEKGLDTNKEDWKKAVQEVTRTITLDSTPPEVVSLEPVSRPVSRSVERGKSFVVRAKGLDPQSGLRDVVFFLGKLPPSADLPKDLIVVPGEGKQGKKNESSTWTAALTAFSDVRSPLDVSVRFTNNVGLSTTKSISLDVTNPPPPPAGGVAVRRASIAGVVMEGDRPQKGLVVELQDAAGKTLLTSKTAADGAFLFPDLLPGGYRVASAKPASKTRGVAGAPEPITVAAGEAKKGVVVRLWRE